MSIGDYQLPYCTITGTFVAVDADSADPDLNPDVQPLNGTITLTPTTSAGRVDDAFAQIRPVTARVLGGQIVDDEDLPGVRVLATDANIGVVDWAWRASFKFDGLHLDPLTFKAPRDTEVNLTSGLVPIKSQPYQIIEGASIVDAEVSGEGTMRFELSDGTFTSWMDVPNGERGLPGEKGDPGPKGADGTSATLAMGSVTAGTTADAWMTGTPLARELNLVLPRGAKGEKGDQGDPGDPATPISASVTVTEGAQWDASLSLSGGVLNLGLTVPPGGVSYWKGRGVLPAYADLDTYRTPELNGSWSIGDNNLGTYTNLPPGLTTRASLEVISPNAWTVTQRVTGTTGTVHTRALYNSANGVWSEWTTPFKGEGRGVLPAYADLDTYRTPAHNGDWGIGDTYFDTYVGIPPGVTARSTLEVVSPNAWTVTQRVTTMGGVVHTRALQNHANDTWTPWTSTQHGSGATVTALPTRDWVHWGDSLTDDSVLGSNSWVSKLAGLTGANHLNEGWYSQRAENIAARQGGLPALVTLSGGEIPASGPIAVTDIVNSPVIANRPSHQVVGELAGRGGYLVADGTGPTGVQFVASSSSTSTPCPPGSVFTPLGPASLGSARHMTICIGANSRMDTEPQVIVSMVQAMIDYQTTRVKRVLVLEIPNRANQAPGGESEQRTGAINAALQAAFPSEYIPLATWLGTDEAAAAAGITFTPEDLTDIGNKLVPRVFRADYVHWNELASTVIADYLYSQAQARGWL